jgi:hypothetical protein
MAYLDEGDLGSAQLWYQKSTEAGDEARACSSSVASYATKATFKLPVTASSRHSSAPGCAAAFPDR